MCEFCKKNKATTSGICEECQSITIIDGELITNEELNELKYESVAKIDEK